MNPVLTVYEGELKYEVYVDYDSQCNEPDLIPYGVVKMHVCKCCCMWSESDSLWDIQMESPEEALELYKAQ